MNCEFDYCIYNNVSACILDEIQMDSLGMCDSCEVVTIPEEDLKKYKEERLEKIDKIWKAYDKQKN